MVENNYKKIIKYHTAIFTDFTYKKQILRETEPVFVTALTL